MTRSSPLWGVLLACLAFAGAGANAQEANPVLRAPAGDAAEGRVLVKFRDASAPGRAQALQSQGATDKVAALASRTGMKVRSSRALGPKWHVVELEPGESAQEQLARIQADDGVAVATLDRRRYPHALPNDPLYAGQWYEQTNATNAAAINAEAAWDTGTGTNGVVIADIDTGVRFDHPDLGRAENGGRLLPGYDFITDSRIANDGDGRDADPTDPGDFLTATEAATDFFKSCGGASNSSWHGTRTAGLIGARTNDAEGIAGGTWTPWILPVRVLGKCGGYDSDIIDAMLWAGGVHINGVPDNAYPAQVENLSLGASGICGQAYTDAIATLSSLGVVVVVSAGNEGGPVDEPANCPGAVGVAGLRHIGTKVGFSSLGPEIALSAPGGNCVNTNGGPCLFPINTTSNSGTTTPGASIYTDQLNPSVGTSFSAPIVSGIAGLMLGANGNLGAAQIRARLREGAVSPFPVNSDPTANIQQCHVPTGPNDLQPSECNCTTSTCGAGMANAPGALLAALRPIAAVVTPGSGISAGQNVPLSAAGSAAACGRTIVSYNWVGAGLATPPNQATATFVAPTSGIVTATVTVTDDAGKQDSADIVLTSNSVATAAPANAGTHACRAAVAPPLPVTVAVDPPTATLVAGASQTFTATVTNTTNTAVSWSVNGVVGGTSTTGTITTAGVFTAPATLAAALAVTVTATSAADSTKTASATVTENPAPVQPQSSGGGGGGGGGGAFGLLEIAGLAALGLLRRWRIPAR